jgi:hypothetical protein
VPESVEPEASDSDGATPQPDILPDSSTTGVPVPSSEVAPDDSGETPDDTPAPDDIPEKAP